MARRVKQADGSYCYTENCRIHDRSFQDSTGRAAVIADLRESQRKTAVATAVGVLTPKYGSKGPEVAERAIHAAVDSKGRLDPYTLASVLSGAIRASDIEQVPGDALEQAHEIANAYTQQAAIRGGDEVFLNETGERGTITEGDTRYGGLVRFNPESMNSRNSFAWFAHKDLTKIMTDENTPAREQIIATPRDHIVSTPLVRQMLEEESSTDTRNPQAAREFRRSGKAAREAYTEFADKFEAKYQGRSITRGHVVKLLNDEYQRPMPGKTEAELRAIKGGLRNIISYLNPAD